MVLLLLSSLVVLACGRSLREKSPSTGHAHTVRATSAVVVAPFVGTTTVVVDVLVVVVSLVDVVVLVVGCCRIVVVVVVVVVVVNVEERCDVTRHMKLMINKHGHMGASHHVMYTKDTFICHVTHPICSNPGTSPVRKSSGLSPVLRNIPPQDCKNWLVHQPILSPGSPQESSGIPRNPAGICGGQ